MKYIIYLFLLSLVIVSSSRVTNPQREQMCNFVIQHLFFSRDDINQPGSPFTQGQLTLCSCIMGELAMELCENDVPSIMPGFLNQAEQTHSNLRRYGLDHLYTKDCFGNQANEFPSLSRSVRKRLVYKYRDAAKNCFADGNNCPMVSTCPLPIKCWWRDESGGKKYYMKETGECSRRTVGSCSDDYDCTASLRSPCEGTCVCGEKNINECKCVSPALTVKCLDQGEL